MLLRKPPSKITHSSCLESYTYKALRIIEYTHSHYIIGEKSIFNIRIEDSYQCFDHIFIYGSYCLASCYKNVHHHQPYRSHLTLTLSSHMHNIIHTYEFKDYRIHTLTLHHRRKEHIQHQNRRLLAYFDHTFICGSYRQESFYKKIYHHQPYRPHLTLT